MPHCGHYCVWDVYCVYCYQFVTVCEKVIKLIGVDLPIYGLYDFHHTFELCVLRQEHNFLVDCKYFGIFILFLVSNT